MHTPQQTLRNPIRMKGLGLHSGHPVSLRLMPAEQDAGIVFVRCDLNPVIELPVRPEAIQEAPLCTLLKQGDVSVSTIEHLMAALSALQVDNVRVELSAGEVPVMDGSAEPFVFAIRSVGLLKQKAARRILKIKKKIRVEEADKFAEFSPFSGGFRLHISIDFPQPVIRQTPSEIIFDLSAEGFYTEVSRARTFGAAKDLDRLHAAKLALGASLDNAVGLSEEGVLNPEGLRQKDEFVRHKLLDSIGDLYVLGPILGQFRGHKTGHALNNRLLRELLSHPDSFEWIE